MTGRMWVLAAAAWIVVVVAGSGLTWVAIDRAGQQVASTGTYVQTPAASAAPQPPPSTPPVSTPSAPPTVVTPPTSSRPGPVRSTPPTPTPPPAPRAQVRTWVGAAGSMTASCSGGLVRLVAASPNDGWQVESGDQVGESVEVKFDKDSAAIKVKASCAGGVPVFGVESSDSQDSHH